jgi:hypothetical protein
MASLSCSVLILAAAAAVSASSGGPRLFVLDDGVKMGPDGRILSLVPLNDYLASNPAWNGRAVTLTGARGETVAFQVVIQGGAHPLPAVDARPDELRREGGGGIPASQFALFREWYLPVTVPSTSPGGSAGKGEYPDALIPASTPGWGLPVDVAAGRTQGVWVDLAIPRDARPGRYTGAITVHAGVEQLRRFEVELIVHDFEIPAERHLRWRIGYSGWEAVPEHFKIAPGSAEWLKLEHDLYRLIWEGHRATPTTHYSDVRVGIRGEGATLAIDWTGFDRRFGRYLDGSAFADRQPINIFSLPLNLHTGWPGRHEAPDPAILTAFTRLAGKHWDEKGWRAQDTFVYVADEPGSDRYDAIRRACTAIRAGDARIRTSVAFYTEFARHAPRIVKEFGGLVTMWDIAGDYLDLPALRARQAAGDSVGFYQGGEPFQGGEALDDDGLALTTWPWIAWRYGLDTLFLYNMTEWSYFRLDRGEKVPWAKGKREIWENPLNQSWPTNSQGVLVYPGQYVGIRGVVPSIRLKQVRRGMQDYEYLWLVAQKGQKATADAVSKRIIPRALHEAGPLGKLGPRGSWTRDPRTWAAARHELAATIVKK